MADKNQCTTCFFITYLFQPMLEHRLEGILQNNSTSVSKHAIYSMGLFLLSCGHVDTLTPVIKRWQGTKTRTCQEVCRTHKAKQQHETSRDNDLCPLNEACMTEVIIYEGTVNSTNSNNNFVKEICGCHGGKFQSMV